MKTNLKSWAVVVVATLAGVAFAQGNKKTDHQQVVGHWGVGYFGVTSVPDGLATGGTGSIETTGAPAVGVRYWMNSKMGLEAAIGLGFTHESGTSNGTDLGSIGTSAFLLHLGAPFALASSQHFTFELIPELAFGYGAQSQTDPADPNTPKGSGYLFSLGGRIGAEIQFGFIGIPQLSLQGSLGLHFELMHGSSSVSALNSSVSLSTWSLTTSVSQAPWKLFTGNISAIYYF